MRRIAPVILAVLPVLVSGQGITAQKARWLGGAKAALSFIHDDICSDGTDGIFNHADTIAYNRGLAFGTGAIVSHCVTRKLWAKLDALAGRGHEIVSHSWSHADARKGWNRAQEIAQGKQTLEANLTRQKSVDYFIFPFDSYDAGSIADLKAAGFLAARTGPGAYADRGVTSKLDGFQPFGSTFFFVYFTKDGNAAMQKHANEAIAAGGWANQEFHGVADGSWEKVPSADAYRQYLDFLRSKVAAGDLWVGTPTQVVKYLVTHNACGSPAVADRVLSFPGAGAVPAAYAAPITVALTVPGSPPSLYASQGGSHLPVTGKDGAFRVLVDPTRGPVTLSTDASSVRLARPGRRGGAESWALGPGTVAVADGPFRLRVLDLAGRTVASYPALAGSPWHPPE